MQLNYNNLMEDKDSYPKIKTRRKRTRFQLNKQK
jgi:hypothetical protein